MEWWATEGNGGEWKGHAGRGEAWQRVLGWEVGKCDRACSRGKEGNREEGKGRVWRGEG